MATEYGDSDTENDGEGNTAVFSWADQHSGEMSVQPPVVLSEKATRVIHEATGISLDFLASTTLDGESGNAGGTLFGISAGEKAGDSAESQYDAAAQAAQMIFSYMRRASGRSE
jgi:hypothetical protein